MKRKNRMPNQEASSPSQNHLFVPLVSEDAFISKKEDYEFQAFHVYSMECFSEKTSSGFQFHKNEPFYSSSKEIDP